MLHVLGDCGELVRLFVAVDAFHGMYLRNEVKKRNSNLTLEPLSK